MDGIETGQSAVKIGYMYLPTHCSLPLSLSLGGTGNPVMNTGSLRCF